MKRFLITTAIEATWRDDEPVVFLGEWCRLYSRRVHWAERDAEVLPYHWDDRDRLHADYDYLMQLHETLLQDLTVQLNTIHEVRHSVGYWRIVVGPWLGYFTQILFDRWTSIQQAISRHSLTGTVILDFPELSMVPSDMAAFGQHFVGDEWNHHIYGMILRQFTSVPVVAVEAASVAVSEPGASRHAEGWRRRFRNRLAMLREGVTRWLSRNEDVFMLGTCLSIVDELKVNLRLRQMPVYRRFPAAVLVPAEASRRRWKLGGISQSDFERCARALIPQQIPIAYLEGFSQLVDEARELRWPRNPRAIWTSSAHGSVEVFKAWAAEKVEQGVPLVIGQHGGHYGIGRWSFTEDHDLAIADGYLTWGWSEPSKPLIKPVGQLRIRPHKRQRPRNRQRALLVTCCVPRFSYWLYSISVAAQWLDYFEEQCTFVERLPESIRNALTVRLYPQDYGWEQLARWRDRFPALRLDNGESSMEDLIGQSRLYISTYNATTYLESLVKDVPTIIFWKPEHWELRASATADFDDLKRVGIFHETPESAAQQVAAVWEDVDAWWNGAEVRHVLQRFRQRYCRSPDDLSSSVAAALREVIADSQDRAGS